MALPPVAGLFRPYRQVYDMPVRRCLAYRGDCHDMVAAEIGDEFRLRIVCDFRVRDGVPAEKKEESSRIPKTTKQDSMNHGMGIRNIKDILEKNGGVINIDVNACEYTVMIMLHLEL